MTDHQRQDPITQYRIEARRLLRQLQSSDSEEAANATGRFRQLRSFSRIPIDEVLYLVERVRLKHALAVIAQERGYESWKALKTAYERAEGRFDGAEHVFRRMLWLNPSDNQGARFLLNEVRSGFAWADYYGERVPESTSQHW